MKIIFAGTPQFSADHLDILLSGDNEICAVLTQPDRKSGRGKKESPSPVKEKAIKFGIPVLQPVTLKDESTVNSLKAFSPDIILVVAYGLIIPQEVLDLPKMGCINIHASLLPRWRGASPMEHAIFSGDKETGISIMKMVLGLDEGPVFKEFKCAINNSETLESLEKKLLNLSEVNLNYFLTEFKKNALIEEEQDELLSTYAGKIDTSFTQINWNEQTAIEIERKIRSLYPKYGCYTHLGDSRLKIHSSSVVNNKKGEAPGEVFLNDSGDIEVTCVDLSILKINSLQMPGKNKVTSEDFVRGNTALLKEWKFFSYRSN